MPDDAAGHTIEMRLLVRRQGGADRFYCSLSFWDFMINLGETFGWKPRGSSYVLTSIRVSPKTQAFKHDYRPGARRDAKVVDHEDAIRWANALALARASRHLSHMIAARYANEKPIRPADTDGDDSEQSIGSLMDNFIVYLRKGTFSFATKDSNNVIALHVRE